MVPRLGSWAATVGQVPCAVAVADQGVYLRGDNLIERWGNAPGEKQPSWPRITLTGVSLSRAERLAGKLCLYRYVGRAVIFGASRRLRYRGGGDPFDAAAEGAAGASFEPNNQEYTLPWEPISFGTP